MAYLSKHPKFDDVIFKDNGLGGSVPNPASGSDKIVNRGGNFFSRSSTGAEKPLGGGGGELNVFTDTDGIGATWVASGAGVTVANTTTTSEIALYPIKTTAIKVTNVSGTDYVRGRFTMPAGLKNKKLKWEFFQEALSGYVDGDSKIEVYTNTASNYGGTYAELPLSTDVSGDSLLPNLTGKFTTYFDSDDSDYYEVRIVRVSGTAAITFGGIIVGPGIQPQGAVVGEWIDFDPQLPVGLVVTSYEAKYRRVGSSVEVQSTVLVGTGSTGSTPVIWNLPNGWTIDTATYPHGGGTALGSSEIYQNPRLYGGIVSYTGNPGVGELMIINGYAAGTTGGNEIRTLSTGDLNNGDYITMTAMVQVAELYGAGVLNLAENAVEYAFNTDLANANDLTSFGYGPQGTQFGNFSGGGPTKRFRFQTPIQKGDKIEFEVSANAGVVWQTLESNNIVSPYQAQGGTAYGALMDVVAGSDTDMDVTFGNHRVANPATFGAAGSNWSDIDNDPQFLWRVKKTSANAALGFALADENQAGLVNPYVEGAGVVYSGTWTPGVLGSVNIDNVTNLFGKYTRVGNIVTCSFYADVDANVTGNASFDFTLPIPSNFAAATDMVGAGTNVFDKNVSIFGSPAPNTGRMSFTAVVLTATTWTGSFQYEVLP